LGSLPPHLGRTQSSFWTSGEDTFCFAREKLKVGVDLAVAEKIGISENIERESHKREEEYEKKT